ncbi:transcription antitermination factor NusB [Parafannyhessea umbonata]|uniref:transcription antitermination factor NusB n=1 Tax=Parafannyhessea umbonata TaxID=604330 RepID=UPI0026F07526|nr:transcription antitermination factor NusB [Parafannyhessea umbonata]MCI7219014.1 hypothetical protein [Parafannyhessea umbonata]MDD7199733.1 transcription antitermination factor NusB [Parafannyhessea umbonata]MDY4418461.1 transcription antitermination factor NusB [Parafannyhessea umbonata]
MARLAPARRAALRLGAECRQRDARAREVLRTSDVMDGLEARDRALATRLVLGVQRARGLCDAVVNAHLTHSHLEPRVRDALRLSAFELLYLGTPTQVAVSQGVELAAVASRRARGLANAVLRRVAAGNVPAMEAARGRVRAARDAGSVPEVADVALVGALPEWLARELVASLGAGACALALDAMEPPAPTVAANLNLNTEGQAFARLADAGLQPSRLPWPGCIALGAQAGLAASGLVEETCVLPADPAAQMVSWLAAPAAGVGTMLEVGQGRATKTLLIAGANRRLGGKVLLACVDSVAFKSRLARERVRTGGLDGRATCVTLDATRLDAQDVPRELRGTFGQVFVDAPCSGTGTMRRHPEVAWSLGHESVCGSSATLPTLQLRMLSAASARVAPGGTLAYSTCSDLRAEDEDVVRAFLASEAGRAFAPLPATEAPCTSVLDAESLRILHAMTGRDGFLRTEGGRALGLDCDGHFLALMRRVG